MRGLPRSGGEAFRYGADFGVEMGERRGHGGLALFEGGAHAQRRFCEFLGGSVDFGAKAAFGRAQFFRHDFERAQGLRQLGAKGLDMLADAVLPQGSEHFAGALDQCAVGSADLRIHRGKLGAQGRERIGDRRADGAGRCVLLVFGQPQLAAQQHFRRHIGG